MSKENVIDDYLIWEICKQKGIKKRILKNSANERELKKELIAPAKKEFREKNYSIEEKKENLKELDNNAGYRLKIFEESSWSKQPVQIEDLGTTLPRAGDLPPGVITKALPEVMSFVEKADPEKYESVKYIKSLGKYSELLREFHPWVITPGNRPSKIDRMNKVHGKQDWEIKDTWGMINDGNHRAIAKILASDSKEIECYVGHRTL